MKYLKINTSKFCQEIDEFHFDIDDKNFVNLFDEKQFDCWSDNTNQQYEAFLGH